MSRSKLLVAVGCAFLLSSCNSSGGGSADERMAELEKKVAATQEENRDLRAKMRIAQSFGARSPLAEFFAADEFWQCTYDSSWTDCSKRCADQAAEHRSQCEKMTDEQDSLKCYTEASDNAANCVQACPVQMSPTSPPNCGGGIL